MPKRLQRKRTKGFNLKNVCQNPKGYIYCGRPSKYANPFGWQKWGRDIALVKFRLYLNALAKQFPEFYKQCLTELRGHDLSCWCRLDELCHADIWLELANQSE